MGCTSAKPAAAAPQPRNESKAAEQNKQPQPTEIDDDVSTTDESVAKSQQIEPLPLDTNTTATVPIVWEFGEPDEDDDEDDTPSQGCTKGQLQCPKCGSANSTLMEVTIGATHESWGRSWKDCKYNCVNCNRELDAGVSADVCRKCKCFWHRNGKAGCAEFSQVVHSVEIIPEEERVSVFPVIEPAVIQSRWCCAI